MQKKEDRLLSIGDAADYIEVSIDTLRRWEKKGIIKAYRSSGKHRYFDKDDLRNAKDKKYTRVKPTKRRTNEELGKETVDIPTPAVLEKSKSQGPEPHLIVETVPMQIQATYHSLPMAEPTPPLPSQDDETVSESEPSEKQQEAPQTLITSHKPSEETIPVDPLGEVSEEAITPAPDLTTTKPTSQEHSNTLIPHSPQLVERQEVKTTVASVLTNNQDKKKGGFPFFYFFLLFLLIGILAEVAIFVYLQSSFSLITSLP